MNETTLDKRLIHRMPYLKGTQHLLKKEIQETQQTIEGRCFV